jgi:hypothetical protein
MKQIFPSLQRFHIETIMYLIVIIVALVLLYLFINNKINLFEEFQATTTTTAAPTTAAPTVNCRAYANVSGCETTSDQIGRFNLIYFHDAECPYSQAFKTKVWDKIFKSGESELNDVTFDASVMDTISLFFLHFQTVTTTRSSLPPILKTSLTEWLDSWYEIKKDKEDFTAEKEQYKIRMDELLDKYIKDNYNYFYCNTPDEKMKCKNPKTVVDSDSSSQTTASTPTTGGVTPLSSVEPNIKYIDRGYYKIHPFFERWFKDIFIITLVNSEYEVEFIKRLSTTDDIIHRFEMGWMDPDDIADDDDEYYNDIKGHIEDQRSESNYGNLSTVLTNESWGNKIGEDQNSDYIQEMIRNYVQNIILNKFGVKHTPAIIIEDTEKTNSENSYKCNTGNSLEDPDVFNFKLSDSYPPDSSGISRNSNYNLILLGQDHTDKDTQEAVPLEEIFYNKIIKFVDDRFQIFDDLGCHTEPIVKPEFYIYVYYGDNCETSRGCLNHIISEYETIINTWKDLTHSEDKLKILFIKVKTSEECKSNQILCMDNEDTNIDKLGSNQNITFHLHNPNISTTTNSGSKPNTIDHDVLNQFIQNYDKNNLKLPYIIMFLKYKDHKAIKSYNWGVDINKQNFTEIYTKFHDVYAKDIHDAAARTTAARTTAARTTAARTTAARTTAASTTAASTTAASTTAASTTAASTTASTAASTTAARTTAASTTAARTTASTTAARTTAASTTARTTAARTTAASTTAASTTAARTTAASTTSASNTGSKGKGKKGKGKNDCCIM